MSYDNDISFLRNSEMFERDPFLDDPETICRTIFIEIDKIQRVISKREFQLEGVCFASLSFSFQICVGVEEACKTPTSGYGPWIVRKECPKTVGSENFEVVLF